MSEPLSGYEHWTLNVEGENNVFKRCAVIVFHQIMNEFAVCFLSFGFISIGHSCRTDNGHIIAHCINKTHKTGINREYTAHAHFPFSLIHLAGALT